MHILFIRAIGIVFHGLANWLLISWFTETDVSGSWLTVICLFLMLAGLIWLTLVHIYSFIRYIKTRIS